MLAGNRIHARRLLIRTAGGQVAASELSHSAKLVFKTAVQVLSLIIALPFAVLAGFGRFSLTFTIFAHFFALMPGLPGDYLRVAYYVLTLRKCALHSRISFGSFFAQSSAIVGRGVYIGGYCVLGGCNIGERTQIATHVQILGGRHQHARGPDGHIMGANEDEFEHIVIGTDCWIGASAIVMADVGSETTIGAGAVVTRPVPTRVVAVGNPARALERVMQ
jgi:acetyltransferase-like isoleucine patch superfamily enzyme